MQLPPWLGDLEYIGLHVVAFLLLAAFLLMIADTPLYPVAIGIEIIVLFYLLTQPAATAALTGLSNFTANPTKGFTL